MSVRQPAERRRALSGEMKRRQRKAAAAVPIVRSGSACADRYGAGQRARRATTTAGGAGFDQRASAASSLVRNAAQRFCVIWVRKSLDQRVQSSFQSAPPSSMPSWMRWHAALMPTSSRPVTAQRERLYLRCFLTGIGQAALSSLSGWRRGASRMADGATSANSSDMAWKARSSLDHSLSSTAFPRCGSGRGGSRRSRRRWHSSTARAARLRAGRADSRDSRRARCRRERSAAASGTRRCWSTEARGCGRRGRPRARRDSAPRRAIPD